MKHFYGVKWTLLKEENKIQRDSGPPPVKVEENKKYGQYAAFGNSEIGRHKAEKKRKRGQEEKPLMWRVF